MADTRDNNDNPSNSPETLTIEGEWEQSSDAESDATDSDLPAASTPRRLGKFIGLLIALALIGGVSYGAYLGWQQVDRYLAQQAERETSQARLSQQIEALEQRLDNINRTVAVDGLAHTQRDDQLKLELKQLTRDNQLNGDQIIALQTQLADWAERFGNGDKPQQNQWQLAEAEWLLWLANMRLQLQHQYTGAIIALGHADQLLQQVNHPQMRQIRGKIAEEVITLKTTEQPDIDSIALVLLALSNQAAELPLPARPRPAGQIQKPTTQPADLNQDEAATWRQLLTGIWQEVRGLVVIRRQEKNLRPWLSENEEQLIYQGLQVRLDASRLAALRGQNNLFQQSVRSAQTWLLTWFDSESAAVQAVDDELDALAKQKITLNLPDISGSLTALRELRQQPGQ